MAFGVGDKGRRTVKHYPSCKTYLFTWTGMDLCTNGLIWIRPFNAISVCLLFSGFWNNCRQIGAEGWRVWPKKMVLCALAGRWTPETDKKVLSEPRIHVWTMNLICLNWVRMGADPSSTHNFAGQFRSAGLVLVLVCRIKRWCNQVHQAPWTLAQFCRFTQVHAFGDVLVDTANPPYLWGAELF